jgi:hypothetical protein
MASNPTLHDLFRTATGKSGTGLVVIDRHYRIAEPIVVRDANDLHVMGKPGIRPVVTWMGDGGNMFDLANCANSLFERFYISVVGHAVNVFHYWRKERGPGTVVPTNNRHKSLSCLVMPTGSAYTFASHDLYDDGGQYAGYDENNEFGLYDDCDVNGTLQGMRFMGQQSHAHVINRCRLNAKLTAVVSSGWFSATDVSSSGCQVVFHLLGVSSPVHIVRPNCEAVGRLLVTGDASESGFTGDSQAVLIEGGSTRCDQLAPNTILIDLKSAGPLRVVGHQFGSGEQRIPRIRTWHQGAVSIEGCDLGSWGSAHEAFVLRPDGSRDIDSSVIGCKAHTRTGKVTAYYGGPV